MNKVFGIFPNSLRAMYNGVFVFGLFAALAEFERGLIVERTNAELDAVRATGRMGGRPRKVDVASLKMVGKTLVNTTIAVVSAYFTGVAIVPSNNGVLVMTSSKSREDDEDEDDRKDTKAPKKDTKAPKKDSKVPKKDSKAPKAAPKKTRK